MYIFISLFAELFKMDNTASRKRPKLPAGMKHKNKKAKLNQKPLKKSKEK